MATITRGPGRDPKKHTGKHTDAIKTCCGDGVVSLKFSSTDARHRIEADVTLEHGCCNEFPVTPVELHIIA